MAIPRAARSQLWPLDATAQEDEVEAEAAAIAKVRATTMVGATAKAMAEALASVQATAKSVAEAEAKVKSVAAIGESVAAAADK